MWKRKLTNIYNKNPILCKSLLVLLWWDVVTDLFYNRFFSPSAYAGYHYKSTLCITVLIAAMFLASPLAGYLADSKIGRFQALVGSTYVTLISVIMVLFFAIVITFFPHSLGYNFFQGVVIALGLAVIGYLLGRMVFIVNILQFVMEHLRDKPTKYSVSCLYLFYWSKSFINLAASGTNYPDHVILDYHKVIVLDKIAAIHVAITTSFTIVSLILILAISKRRPNWFISERPKGNAYTLVYRVVRFASRNKKPVYRSAFTYCEDELPSRMDLGKQRYGGPFTTEQVEDVKVLFGMLKVLISLGPAFLLDFAVTMSAIHSKRAHTGFKRISEILFFDYGLISTMVPCVSIPLFVFLLQPYISRYIPNMFKRIGLGILMLCTCLLLLLFYDVFALDSNNVFKTFSICVEENATYAFTRHRFEIPLQGVMAVQQVISSISQMLIYIGAWEFICCQSPQHMKGLTFGLFYLVRALFQCLAVVPILPFFTKWNSENILSCRSVYYLVNVGIGSISLIIYCLASRGYKYRKREDICNVYQYAEDYYSNIP